MKKLFLMLLISLLFVSMVSAGGQKAASNSGKVVVAFSQMEMNNAWRVAETASIRAEAQKRGIELIYTDAQGDTAKQVSDVEDIIARKPNVILLAPREYEGLAPALAAAKRAGIPLILIDRDAQGEPGVDYASLISANFIWEGQQCAQVLVKRFGTSQEVNVVQITGTPGSSVAIDRQKGFEDELTKYPNFKIIATQNGEFTRSIAQNVMSNIVQSQGGRINAVYGHDDECAIGALQALKAAGFKPGADIAVVGVGGFKDAALLIQQNEMDATILCSPFFGPTAFDAAEKLVRGEKLPTFIQNPGRVIDKSNVDAYMPDAF
ncbi:MAG: ABC transporter substrate-binding protein [Treponema sp.]|jgi:ribose transport system substrate-binding protein|nr:ABC transporter substrate-binding protein [Treponema sp.]